MHRRLKRMWMRNSQGLTKIFTEKASTLTPNAVRQSNNTSIPVSTPPAISPKNRIPLSNVRTWRTVKHIFKMIFQDDLTHLQDDTPWRFSTSPRYGANSILQRRCLWARLQVGVLADYNCDFMSSRHTCPRQLSPVRCDRSRKTAPSQMSQQFDMENGGSWWQETPFADLYTPPCQQISRRLFQ